MAVCLSTAYVATQLVDVGMFSTLATVLGACSGSSGLREHSMGLLKVSLNGMPVITLSMLMEWTYVLTWFHVAAGR